MKNHHGLCLLSRFPLQAIWTFAVDGRFYVTQNGPEGYDSREKNSVNRTLLAISELMNSAQITGTKLLEIHKKCMSGIISAERLGTFRPQTHSVGYTLEPTWITQDGLDEFSKTHGIIPRGTLLYGDFIFIKGKGSCTMDVYLAALQKGWIKETDAQLCAYPDRAVDENILAKASAQKCQLIYHAPKAQESMLAWVNHILETYYSDIQSCRDDDAKLNVIIDAVKKLTRLHPFFDGNNRLFVNGLLNAWLIQNDFGPAILYDPNIFEFHSRDELRTIVKTAMAVTADFINTPDASIYDFNPSQLSPQISAKHMIFARIFMQGVAERLVNEAEQCLAKADYQSVGECLEALNQMESSVIEKFQSTLAMLQDTLAQHNASGPADADAIVSTATTSFSPM